MSGNLGTGYLQVIPKFDGLTSSVKRALGGVDVSGEGTKLGASYTGGVTKGMGGLAKGGAVMGAFAAITSGAMHLVAQSVGSAARRLDTLNNYPRVMQALGYSSEAAQGSIAKMDEHLRGLPTSIDSMVSSVQGIAAVTGDLDKATDAGLALNDMLLASGANTQVANAAMEQFRQMLAKGKPDMQDWKSLTSAMPGQMDQLAKSLLGPTANANDLYEALGGGGHEATVTMGQLMDAMVDLDKNGSSGMASFAQQAKDATGGMQASFENMKTAITRGVADMLKGIGVENIRRVLGDVGSLIENTFAGLGGVMGAVMPPIRDAVGALAQLESSTHLLSGGLTAVITAFAGFKAVQGTISTVDRVRSSFENVSGVVGAFRDRISSAREAYREAYDVAVNGLAEVENAGRVWANTAGDVDKAAGLAKSGVAGLGVSAAGLATGIGIAAAAVGVAAAVFAYYHRQSELARQGTSGLTSATWGFASGASSAASQADLAAAAYGGVGRAATNTARSVSDMRQSQADAASSVEQAVEAYETQKATLEDYLGVIDDLAGRTGLSTDQQMRLQAAVDGYNQITGDSLSVIDAQNGRLSENTDQIHDNASAWEEQARQQALAQAEQTLMQQQLQNQKDLNDATNDYNNLMSQKEQMQGADADSYNEWVQETRRASDAMDEAGRNIDATNLSMQDMADTADGTAGRMTAGASAIAGALHAEAGALSGIGGALATAGTDVSDFASACDAAGISTETLAALGKDGLTSLAKACDNDVGRMTGAISTLNALGIDPKTVSVHDDGTIQLASGQILDLNSQTIDGKHFTVSDDGTVAGNQAAVDALNARGLDPKHFIVTDDGTIYTQEGQVVNLDSMTIGGKPFYVTDQGTCAVAEGQVASVDARGIGDKPFDVCANDHASSLMNRVDSWHPSNKVFDVIVNLVSPAGNAVARLAAGLMASGGFVAAHAAGGYIVDRPTVIGRTGNTWHVAGEAGAEWVEPHSGGVIPLSNHRYVRPFAKAVAREMRPDDGGTAAEAARLVLAALPGIIRENAPAATPREFGRMVRSTL